MTGVIYARYSSDNQREESIEGQLRECNEYAEKNGITIVATYIDRAVSAKTDKRPEFQRMIENSKKELFDVVLVWKFDRFSRDIYDSLFYKRQLGQNGVKVTSIKEDIADNAMGQMMENILEAWNQFFSADLAQKVKRGMTENALKAKFNGGTITLGYMVGENQEYQIDPQWASIVLQCFNHYASGKTMKQVVEWLNTSGINGRFGKPFTINIVTTMLKNRRYTGEYRYADTVTPDAIPVIVPPELFQKVQERMEKNKRAPARHKAEDDYILTTKLFCGQCGAFMVGECGTSKTKTKKHHYYKCVSVKKRKGCTKKTVRKLWIEDVVIFYAMRMIMDDAVLEGIADELLEFQKKENTTLPLLRKQLAENERAITNMLNAIQQGLFNESTKQRLDDLEATKHKLNIAITQEEIQRPRLTKEQILFWLHKFRGLDMTRKDHRQRLIDSLVNAVVLHDDKIVFTFNGKEGAQTISMVEIMREMGSDLQGSVVPTEQEKRTCP